MPEGRASARGQHRTGQVGPERRLPRPVYQARRCQPRKWPAEALAAKGSKRNSRLGPDDRPASVFAQVFGRASPYNEHTNIISATRTMPAFLGNSISRREARPRGEAVRVRAKSAGPPTSASHSVRRHEASRTCKTVAGSQTAANSYTNAVHDLRSCDRREGRGIESKIRLSGPVCAFQDKQAANSRCRDSL
jgi:hypothetical protein